jgi:two-component system CheB/CheR fusion protein
MTPPDSFLAVGIGASAGGIEALDGFFQGLPQPLHAAYLITTHLSPDRHSLLTEVVTRFTQLPVAVATDGMTVEAGKVYVMPEATTMTVADGRIVLHEDAAPRERKPVDILLASLAVEYGERAVGIILSGGDSDGTLGMKAIKERGGITMAQVADGYGPRHPGMPDTAIAAGVADFAISVHHMGARLLEVSSIESLGREGAGTGVKDLPETHMHEIYAPCADRPRFQWL